jgi:hypothetical protein
MKPIDFLKMPLHLLSLASREKSFVDNPIIGSPHLNRWGLHRYRITLADRLAWSRRKRLAQCLTTEDLEAYARHGLVIKPNFLPPAVFARVRDEAHAHVSEAREMRQGQAVTRRVTLDPVDACQLPNCVAAANDPRLDHLMRYVASHDVTPLMYLQIIIVDPDRGAQDPQTALHIDTFHSIAKAWLFLQDVGDDDGPLAYIPGSHRLDEKRLAWEYAQSLVGCFRQERLPCTRLLSGDTGRPRPARPRASDPGRCAREHFGRGRHPWLPRANPVGTSNGAYGDIRHTEMESVCVFLGARSACLAGNSLAPGDLAGCRRRHGGSPGPLGQQLAEGLGSADG